MLKIFDPNIFEINKNFSYKITEIGKSKNRLLEVDNFFKNPVGVREFLLSLPIQDATKKRSPGVSFFPGYQTFLKYEIPCLNSFYKEVCQEVFGFKFLALTHSYQCIDGNKPVYKQSCLPHADPMIIASNVFLNYDEEIESECGTAFYKSKHTGNEYKPPDKCQYRIDRDYAGKPPDMALTRFAPIIYNDDWERYHLSEQKFNKMNMYEGALYHAAFMKFNTFTKVPRISSKNNSNRP
mgnify:FL=1